MTVARIQPCVRKLGFKLGYYNGKEIRPRNIIERNKALFLYINHPCLIWKSLIVSFEPAIRKLKVISKLVDDYITE